MQNWPFKQNRTCNPNNLVIVATVSLHKKPTFDSSLPNENPQDLTPPNGSKMPPHNSNLIPLLKASAVPSETTHEDVSNNNATFSENNTEPRKTCCDTKLNSEPDQTILSTSIINVSSDSDNGNTSLINTPQALEEENKEANSSAELISESSPGHTSASWATNFLMSVGAVQIKPLKLNLSTKKKEKSEEKASNLTNTTDARSSQNKTKETLSKIPTLTNLSCTSCTQIDQVSKDTSLTDNLDHYIKSCNKPGNFNDNTYDVRDQFLVTGGPLYLEQIPGNATSYMRNIETNLFQDSVPMNYPNIPNYLLLKQSNETHSAQSLIPNVYPNYYEGHIRNIETSSEKRFTSTYKIPKLSSRNTSVASSRSLSRSSTESRVVNDKIGRYNEFAIESYEAAMKTCRRRPEDYLEQNHTKIRKLNDGEKEKHRGTDHKTVSRRQDDKKPKKQKHDKNRVDSGKPKDKNREVNLPKAKDKSKSPVKSKSRSLRTFEETASNKSETDHKTNKKKSLEKSSTPKNSSEKHRSTEECKAHKLNKISSKRRRHSSESTSDSPCHSVEKKKCTAPSRKNLSLDKNAKSLKLSNKDVDVRSVDKDKISKSKRDETKEHTIKSVVKKMVREKALSLLRNQNKKEYEELESIKKNKTTTDNIEDLREQLSRRTLNDYFTACLNKRDYQPKLTERDNLIITVDNEEDIKTPELETPDAPNKKKKKVSKSKKNKKIKVVINIKYDNDDNSSNESDDSEEKDSDKSDLDLSFLDLNVDDIVSCLQNCSNETDNEANEDKIKPESIETLYTNKTVNIQSSSTPFSPKESIETLYTNKTVNIQSSSTLFSPKESIETLYTNKTVNIQSSSTPFSPKESIETLYTNKTENIQSSSTPFSPKESIETLYTNKTVNIQSSSTPFSPKESIETLYTNKTENIQRSSTPFLLKEEEPEDFLLESKDELAGIKHYLNNVSASPEATLTYDNVESSKIHTRYPSNETLILENFDEEVDRKQEESNDNANIRSMIRVKSVNELNSVEYSVQENNTNITEFINVYENKHNICVKTETKVETSNYIKVLSNDQSSSVETIIIDLDSPRIGEKVAQTDKRLSPIKVCAQDIEAIDLINGEASIKTGIPHKVTDNKNSEEHVIIDLSLDDISSEEYRTFTSQIAANDMNITDDIVEVSEICDTDRIKNTERIKDTKIKLSESQIAMSMSTLDVQELQTKLGEISENKSEIGTIVVEDKLLNLDTEDDKEEVKITEKDNKVTGKDDQNVESKSIVAKEQNATEIESESKIALDLIGKVHREDTHKEDTTVLEDDPISRDSETKRILVDNEDVTEELSSATAFADINVIEKPKNDNIMRKEDDKAIVETASFEENGLNNKGARDIEIPIDEKNNNDNADGKDGKDFIMKEEDTTIIGVDKFSGDNEIIDSMHKKGNSETPIIGNNRNGNADSNDVIMKEEDEASEDDVITDNIDRKDNTDIERKIIISIGESIINEKADSDDVIKTNEDNTVFDDVSFRGDEIKCNDDNELPDVENPGKETASEVFIKKEEDEIMASIDESNIFGNENRNEVSEDHVSISEENHAVIKDENFKATLAENERFNNVKDEDNRVKEFDDKQAMKDYEEESIRKSDEKGAIRKTSANKTRKTDLNMEIVKNKNQESPRTEDKSVKNKNQESPRTEDKSVKNKNQESPRTEDKSKPSPTAFDSLDQPDQQFIFDSQKSIDNLMRQDHYRRIEFKNMLPQDKHFAVKLEERMDDFMQQKYVVTAFIRKGRFSKIYHCKDAAEQDFAVKIIMNKNYRHSLGIAKEDMIMKLQHEISRDNLNFVYLMNGFSFQNHWCFFMEYCSKNLWQVLMESEAGFHIDKVQILSRQLVTAVAVLRHNHIVHGEINPSHILLSADNRLKLCGFECAFHINDADPFPAEDITKYSCWPHRASCFTNYRAPELLMGFKLDYAIDVWTTAMVMLHMATNQTLVTGLNSPNELLFKLQCILGNMPREMIERSKFTWQHFSGRDFRHRHNKTCSKLIPHFYEKPTLIRKLLHNAYREDHGQHATMRQRKANTRKLMSLAKLLEEMLVLHPRDRMPIEFVYANPFYNII